MRETSEPLRDRFAPHPFAGMIDGYQWVLFLAAHTDRHAAQIEETLGRLGSNFDSRFHVDAPWNLEILLSPAPESGILNLESPTRPA